MQVLNPEDIRYLVVHCSDTDEGEAQDAAEIHAMHLGFGWHGIGYHKVIRKDGAVENGRPEYWVGAHVLGFNQQSLGVCLIGKQSFSDEQFAALNEVLTGWIEKYPQAVICGHRDFAYTEKTCPNFELAAWCRQQGLERNLYCGDPIT